MLEQELAQGDRRPLIKEYAHLRGRRGTPRSVFENSADLLKGYACEPLHELRHLRAVLQILEQGGDRNARATEHPGAADTFGITFYCWARRPINHLFILPLVRPEG